MKYATPYRKNSTVAHFGSRTYPHTTANIGRKFGLNRALLPEVIDYLKARGIALKGRGLWRDAICPFHDDHNASLRINSVKGCFKCMACGAKGGDLIAFHQQLTGLGFIETCKALGAWEQQ